MIKRARTTEEKNLCREYLKRYDLVSCTDTFLYVVGSNGEITGVAGITIGLTDTDKVGYIEPYYADNNISNLKLYCGCEGLLLGWDAKYIIVGCQENNTTEAMYENIGYERWSKNMNQYIKTL